MDRVRLLELELWGGNGFNASYSSYLIQDSLVIIWPLFPLLSTSENRCVNSMKPLVKQIWWHCEFLRWKRHCIDSMVVCNEMLPISKMYLVYRKYFLYAKHGSGDTFWDIVWQIYCTYNLYYSIGCITDDIMCTRQTQHIYCGILIHSVFCLTTGPKPPPKRFLHIVRSRASSFK